MRFPLNGSGPCLTVPPPFLTAFNGSGPFLTVPVSPFLRWQVFLPQHLPWRLSLARIAHLAAAQLARALGIAVWFHEHGRCLVGKCVFSFIMWCLAVAGAQLAGASALSCVVSECTGCSVGVWACRL